MTVTIHNGDCRDVMRTLLEKSVHTCISSPPYFGLRDYDIPPTSWPETEFTPMVGLPPIRIPAMECCLGLEPDPMAFVGHMVAVYREVHRVLRDDGTCWVNLGDSYANDGKWGGSTGGKHAKALHGNTAIGRGKRTTGIPAKNLMLIPARVALAFQADGWIVRQDNIWSKPNPMPESVRDRCAKSHEYFFLLAKQERYYFDSEAIKEPLASTSVARLAQAGLAEQIGSDRVPGKTNGNMKAVRAKGNRRTFRGGGAYTAGQSFDNDAAPSNDSVGNVPNESDVRNKRSVWTVATQPYFDAHFATYPPALIEPCVLAGCPVGGVVLDPFGGSGTTGEVAERLGRNAVLIELNPNNADLCTRRTQQGGLSLSMEAQRA